jgi:hypothetical protein
MVKFLLGKTKHVPYVIVRIFFQKNTEILILRSLLVGRQQWKRKRFMASLRGVPAIGGDNEAIHLLRSPSPLVF